MEEGVTTGVTRGAGEEGPHTTTTDRPRLLPTVDTTQMETGRKVDRHGSLLWLQGVYTMKTKIYKRYSATGISFRTNDKFLLFDVSTK